MASIVNYCNVINKLFSAACRPREEPYNMIIRRIIFNFDLINNHPTSKLCKLLFKHQVKRDLRTHVYRQREDRR